MWRKDPTGVRVALRWSRGSSELLQVKLGGICWQRLSTVILDDRQPFKTKQRGTYPALDAYRNIGKLSPLSTENWITIPVFSQ